MIRRVLSLRGLKSTEKMQILFDPDLKDTPNTIKASTVCTYLVTYFLYVLMNQEVEIVTPVLSHGSADFVHSIFM